MKATKIQSRTYIVLSKLPPTKRIKVDNYEYESLAKDILEDKVSYNSMCEIFNDKAYWEWFEKKYVRI